MPSNIAPGSIVDITVARNEAAEEASAAAFQTLQKRILNTYGIKAPSRPVLRLRNATQTSLVLGWDPIELATASIKSLSLYRNGSKAGSIPRPLETRSTKISGLAIHTEYTFQLVLRTSAGTYQSEKLRCRTHKMTDLSGIIVCPGIMPPPQKDALGAALDRIGGKLVDSVTIETTHFACIEGRGPMWEKAVDMNIPVVRPEWVEACEAEGTLVSVRGYYLNADPKTRQFGPGKGPQQQQQQQQQDQQQQQAAAAASTTSVVTPSSPSHQPESPEPAKSTDDEKKEEAADSEGAAPAETSQNEEEAKGNDEATDLPEDEEKGASSEAPQEQEEEAKEETEQPSSSNVADDRKSTEETRESTEEAVASPETDRKSHEDTSKKSDRQQGDSELSEVPL